MPRGAGTQQATFLLLHGIGLSHRAFTRAAKLLVEHGDVIAIDLPGFGGTPRPDRPLSVRDYAHGVAAVLDRTQMGPMIAVGHSMGAQFALELAITRPDLVSGVVMIGPVVDPRRRTLWQQGLRLLRDAALEPLSTNLMVLFDYARCGPVWFLAETRAMLAYPTHERIQRLTRPLLVLRGRNDPIADQHWATWLATQVSDGHTRRTSRYRHNVVHSSPTETVQPIVRFADTLTSAAP
ncbi:alpha/beta fold hydrolase [Subtercola frigoramans]